MILARGPVQGNVGGCSVDAEPVPQKMVQARRLYGDPGLRTLSLPPRPRRDPRASSGLRGEEAVRQNGTQFQRDHPCFLTKWRAPAAFGLLCITNMLIRLSP